MNQSARDRRTTRGMKYCSICSGESWSQTLLRDSTALRHISRAHNRGVYAATHLVSHKRLLDGSEVLQGREEHVPILGAAHVFDKAAQLIAQGCEHFVLVFHRFCGAVSAVCLRTEVFDIAVIPSKKGISSSLVRSGPNARAMVDSRRIAFSRRRTSSCW